MQVQLTGRTATQPTFTDADGKYYLDQLLPGDYTVCFDPEYVYPRPDYGYVGGCWHDQPPNSGSPARSPTPPAIRWVAWRCGRSTRTAR